MAAADTAADTAGKAASKGKNFLGNLLTKNLRTKFFIAAALAIAGVGPAAAAETTVSAGLSFGKAVWAGGGNVFASIGSVDWGAVGSAAMEAAAEPETP